MGPPATQTQPAAPDASVDAPGVCIGAAKELRLEARALSQFAQAVSTPAHGGGTLVSRTVQSLGSTELLPRISLRDADLTTLHRIADGLLSPLTGPMSKEDYDMVLASRAIERNGRRWAWTIPIILPVTDAEAALLQVATAPADEGASKETQSVDPPIVAALVVDNPARSDGATGKAGRDDKAHNARRSVKSTLPEEVVGTIRVTSVFDWDKDAFLLAVYGTARKDHPGARLWTADTRTKLVGGEISMLPSVDARSFAERVMSPAKTRALLSALGYTASVAFQTRNPLHRAHEYALVYGAETVLRQAPDDCKVGVFLNPLVGQLKGDDVPAEVRMQTYATLVDGGLLGEGDIDEDLWLAKKQSLRDQLHLAGLDMRMYYAGPSEAVMHAIYRQNLGFTHFIIGRKHADAPFDDKTPIWGDFAAQDIFRDLGGELGIKTINVGFAAFFQDLGRVRLLSEHPGKNTVTISGTKMRELLSSGQVPDSRVMRPTTAKILMAHYRRRQESENSVHA